MGANSYIVFSKGRNIEEVFNKLVIEAEHDFGRNPYNGTISTTSLGRQNHLITDKAQLEKALEEDYYQFHENKWETTYADLGISHYEAFTPKWIKDEEKPMRQKGVRTINEYSIVRSSISNVTKQKYQAERSFTSFAEARKAAIDLALNIGEDVTIKKQRSNGTLFHYGEVHLVNDGKQYKSARKTKNKKYIPIKEFALFVFAAN